MSHYDCSNCGEYGGICFGRCPSCTPPEYFKLENRLSSLRHSFRKEAKDAVFPIEQQIFKALEAAHLPEITFLEEKMKSMESKG